MHVNRTKCELRHVYACRYYCSHVDLKEKWTIDFFVILKAYPTVLKKIMNIDEWNMDLLLKREITKIII